MKEEELVSMHSSLYRWLVFSRDRFPAHNEIRSSGKHWVRKRRMKSKGALLIPTHSTGHGNPSFKKFNSL